jgi:uncharacterized protein YndB with AHSA1/START domain
VSDPTQTEGEVRVDHVFDARRETVVAAWTDAEKVAQWWPPTGFEIFPESVEIESTIGGRFHLTMVELEGSPEFPYRATFVEISEPELIVLQAEAIPGWLELMDNLEADLATR